MLTKSKTYAQADIHQISQILQPSQITEPFVLKTHEALQIPRGTRATHRKLVTKLPHPATPKLLRRADRPIAIEITSCNEDGFYNATEHPIQDEIIHWNQHRYTRITKDDLTNCQEIAECPHTKKIRTDNLRNLADFEIKVNGSAIPLITYTTGKFNKTAAESTIHHHSTIWEDLNPQPEWQNILTRTRHPSIPVRIQNLRLKTMHNRLYLGPMMKYIVPNAEYDLTICPLCLEEDSPKHLFLSCRHADNLWRGLSNFLETISGGTITGLTDSEKLFGGLRNPDLEIRTMAEISIAHLQLTLWQSRLRYKHEGTRPTETELEIVAKAAIKHSLEITISAAGSASYDIRRWKLTHEKATEFMRAMD